MKLADVFLPFTACQVGDGLSMLFWFDPWCSEPLCMQYPRLFSFVVEYKWSVAYASMADSLLPMFQLALSEEALMGSDIFQNIQHDFFEGKTVGESIL